jgi:hypothetical protein
LTIETQSNLLQLAPVVLGFAALFVAAGVLNRRKPAWWQRWQEYPKLLTWVQKCLVLTVFIFVGSFLLHALRGLGLILGSWLIHQPLKIPYNDWIVEVVIHTVAALLVSLLFVPKTPEPEDWLDWHKADSQVSEEDGAKALS